MIRLAARFAVSGGRESVTRLVLTAIGVALGVTLLLVAGAVDPAIRAHQERTAWQWTGDQTRVFDEVPADHLLWQLRPDFVDGEEIQVLRVASTGDGAPVPLGLDHVPRPGEVFVSAPMARMLERLPADRLADRYPSAPAGTIPDRFLGGPDDLVVVVGMARSALEGQPGIAAVDRIRTRPEPFQYSDMLRMILGIGALGLLLPVVVFVGTSTRLGAARREQRFAALRLAGATPRQTNVVAAFEAAIAAVVGSLLGGLGFLAVRSTVARVDIDGHPSFPSDVAVPLPVAIGILVGVPLLAVAVAILGLRRMNISPLGVARRAERARPTAKRLLPLAGGAVAFVVGLAVARVNNGTAVLLAVLAAFAVMTYGIVAAGPWLTVVIARVLGRYARRPGALLAGRRLEDDPSGGFRAVSGLVLAVFVASMFSGMSPAIRADNIESNGPRDPSTLVAHVPAGTTSAAADALVEAATQAGATGAVVVHEVPPPDGQRFWRPGQHFLVGPCDDLRATGEIVGPCPDGGTAYVEPGSGQGKPVVPTPGKAPGAPALAADLDVLPAAYVVLLTDGSAATTDRVRTAAQQLVPGSTTFLQAEQDERSNRRITQLDHIANLALALSLIIAGCGLAVAVAGGIIERQRPFALLRLSGVRLGELRRIAMVEASAPLLLIAGASAALGLLVSALVLRVAGGLAWQLPDLGYWLSLAGGLAVALGVAAMTLPLLGRTTAPSAVRFE